MYFEGAGRRRGGFSIAEGEDKGVLQGVRRSPAVSKCFIISVPSRSVNHLVDLMASSL